MIILIIIAVSVFVLLVYSANKYLKPWLNESWKHELVANFSLSMIGGVIILKQFPDQRDYLERMANPYVPLLIFPAVGFILFLMRGKKILQGLVVMGIAFLIVGFMFSEGYKGGSP